MTIFHQLRWKLTLSYTLVTIGAFLVIVLILAGLAFTQIFIPENAINPEQFVEGWLNSTMDSNYQMWSRILSQSPVDNYLVNSYLKEGHSTISGSELFRLGAIQFSASTRASIRVFILGPDGILLGTSDMDNPIYRASIGVEIGKQFDPAQIPGLEEPLRAALAGKTDPKQLYTVLEPDKRYVFAGPIFNNLSGEGNDLVGVMVVFFETLPTQKDIPAHMLYLAGRSLIIFLLGVGLMGAIFGAIFANSLTKRFKRISTTADQWSVGDFSSYIVDTSGDEITQFTQRLNNMAKQLQSLLRRRQEMAVSEERNRLARDLHDSAKQQSLAASLELGTAITLFERDPQEAKTHLLEADGLVDAVRKELTNLVHELRPQEMDGQDFSETLKEYAFEWSQRSEVELNFNSNDIHDLPLEIRETLFRIAQEALANITRHSAASRTDISLDYQTNNVTMTIKDDGNGFDPQAQHSGIGLYSMRERAEVLGGNFIIESTLGQGTQVRVSLPVANFN